MINITYEGNTYAPKVKHKNCIHVKFMFNGNSLRYCAWVKKKNRATGTISRRELGQLFKSWSKFINTLCYILDCYKFIPSIRNVKRVLADKTSRDTLLNTLGCSPKVLHKQFRAAVTSLLIDPIRDLTGKLCVFRGGVQWGNVFDCWGHKEVLRQCIKDGICNITPLVLYYGKSPQELKRCLGKSVWKAACKNTFSRNLLICSKSHSLAGFYGLHHLPTTLLRAKYRVLPINREILAVINMLKSNKEITYRRVNAQLVHLINDTLSQAEKLGKKPKLTSIAKIRRLHDEYTEELLEQEKNQISDKRLVLDIGAIEIEGYTFKPLISEKDLWLEGRKMHHCIYSYLGGVKRGSYYVYHVSGPQQEETIGLSKSAGKWFIDQIYGACNCRSKVPNQVLHSFIDKVNDLWCPVIAKEVRHDSI